MYNEIDCNNVTETNPFLLLISRPSTIEMILIPIPLPKTMGRMEDLRHRQCPVITDAYGEWGASQDWPDDIAFGFERNDFG